MVDTAVAKRKTPRKRRPPGRPTALTPAVQRKICKGLSDGLPLNKAALVAGCSPGTVSHWYARGCDATDREATPQFVEFARAIDEARAKGEYKYLRRIEEAGKGGAVVRRKVSYDKEGNEIVDEQYSQPNWNATAWVMERMDREHWGQVKRIEHSGSVESRQVSIQLHGRLGEGEVGNLLGLLDHIGQPRIEGDIIDVPLSDSGEQSAG